MDRFHDLNLRMRLQAPPFLFVARFDRNCLFLRMLWALRDKLIRIRWSLPKRKVIARPVIFIEKRAKLRQQRTQTALCAHEV